jgi:hypothetical protein
MRRRRAGDGRGSPGVQIQLIDVHGRSLYLREPVAEILPQQAHV